MKSRPRLAFCASVIILIKSRNLNLVVQGSDHLTFLLL